ncbi:JUN kinase kinase kinase activity, variant 2 [Homalodisca vitripennis]|nr:JUN kinase kinase kinase activity, variant 2 [Homalodisca vitripennis]
MWCAMCLYCVVCAVPDLFWTSSTTLRTQLSKLMGPSLFTKLMGLRHYKLASDEEAEEKSWWLESCGGSRNSYLGPDYEFSSSSGYPHNTYHGPAKHYRPLLNNLAIAEHLPVESKPLWFTDSPQHSQHYVPALKQLTPAPSPRRKSSSTSIEPAEVSYPPPPAPGGGMLELRLAPDYYNINLHRSEYYQPPSEYSTPSGHYADRLFPEFSSNEYPAYAYDNPSSSVSSSTTASTRTRHYTHRRTPSNVSNASSCGGTATSSVNPTFSLEGETTGEYQQYYTAYSGWSRSSGGKTGSRQNSIDSTGSERPMTLEVGGTRLRSSLKRYNYSPRNNTGGSSSSGPGNYYSLLIIIIILCIEGHAKPTYPTMNGWIRVYCIPLIQ